MISPARASAQATQMAPLSPTIPATVRAWPQITVPGTIGLIAASMTCVLFMQSEATAGGISRHAAHA